MGTGERFFLGAITPPQAAEGAQFCKLPLKTRACCKAVARGVQGKNQRRLRCDIKAAGIKLGASPALICDQRAPRVGNAAVWCEKIEGLRRV